MADFDDDDFVADELPDLEKAVAEGTRLDVLKALAAHIAHELSGNRCKTCYMSYMKTGEQSSLILRLQKIFEEMEILDPSKLPNPDDVPEKKGGLRDIQRNALRVVGGTASPDSGPPQYGSKTAPRRQGGRKPRFGSD